MFHWSLVEPEFLSVAVAICTRFPVTFSRFQQSKQWRPVLQRVRRDPPVRVDDRLGLRQRVNLQFYELHYRTLTTPVTPTALAHFTTLLARHLRLAPGRFPCYKDGVVTRCHESVQ